MPNRIKHRAPCIVTHGTLFNKRDMIRALDTLESVGYEDIVDGGILSRGKGIVVKVFASKENSTLIVNGALFINVNSFDFLDFETDDSGRCCFRLVGDARILRIVPAVSDTGSHLRPHQGILFSNDEIAEEEACMTMHEDWFDDDYDDL